MPSSRPQRLKCSCSSLPTPSRAKKGFIVSIWHSPHTFGCPFYFHEEKSIFERRLKFNNRLFGTSVHFCLKSIRKAGGYTIFPSLTFCPIVDEYESPAFQLVYEAYTSHCWDNESTPPDLIRNLINQLRTAYAEGSASPRDITPSGENILYVSEEIKGVEERSIALTNTIGNSIVTGLSSRGDDARFP